MVKNELVKNVNLNWSELRVIGLLICLCLYISIYVGYFLSNLIYDFLSAIPNRNFYKMIQFRKKLDLKSIFAFLISYISKFLKNWGMRIVEKFPTALDAIDHILDALQILIKKLKLTQFKFGFKFRFKFLNRRKRYYYRLFKEFFSIVFDSLAALISFIKEVGFGAAIIEFIIRCYNILLLLMTGSIALTSFMYVLYLSVLGLILGFLLGIYKRNKEMDVFMLLFLLELFYIMDKSDSSVKLPHILLEPNEVNQFSTFSVETEGNRQIGLFKILLIVIIWVRGSSLKPEIPFPILGDPSVLIDIDIILNEFPDYELLKFYLKKPV